MNLEGKRIIITGASSGIGAELARQLGRKRAKLALAARRVERLEKVADEARRAGAEVITVRTDVSKRADMENLVRQTVDAFGGLDVLVNNAGVSLAQGTLMDNREDDIRATWEVNFMGGVYGVWAAVPQLEKAGGGLIVFISSILGKRAVAKNAVYSASKFALQGLFEALRSELGPKNIRVLSVCPPGVDTPFFEVNGKQAKRTHRLHPVDKIVSLTIKSCERETRETLLTIDSKLLHWGNVFFPRLLDWAITKNKGVG